MISFAILSHNEGESLNRLLEQLQIVIQGKDEVIIVDDHSNDSYTVQTLNNLIDTGHTVKFRHLNKDFASQKNYLNSLCTQPWIVNIDADELLSDWLEKNIHELLSDNEEVDAFWVPRVNIVEGLTQEDINKWGWRVNEKGYVNFPDPQLRIYKNKPEIKWVNPVHEILTGYKTISQLPYLPEYALIHDKHIDRQRKQNEFYNTI